MSNNKLFTFGNGYVARNLCSNMNIPMFGTSRKSENGILFSEDIEFDTSVLNDVTHILISIPPVNSHDIVLKKLKNDLQNITTLKWVGYLSATSVYGDYGGLTVDEKSITNPVEQRGVERLAVEKMWLNSGLPIHIFRLAGIYGKGRSTVESVLQNKARRIHKKGNIFCRIHIEDIVQALKLSMQTPTIGEIYNLADDLPSSQREVVEYVCSLLNKDYPKLEQFENADLSPMLKSFYNSSRVVSNRKVKEKLGLQLLYPSYKEGVKKIITELGYSS